VSEAERPPRVELIVRASRVDPPAHIDRRFRSTLDSKCSGSDDLYPSIEDVSYRPARSGNHPNRFAAGAVALGSVGSIALIFIFPHILRNHSDQRPTQVQIAVGSETVPFFDSAAAQGIFRTSSYHISVIPIGYGSREMIHAAQRGAYAGFFAS